MHSRTMNVAGNRSAEALGIFMVMLLVSVLLFRGNVESPVPLNGLNTASDQCVKTGAITAFSTSSVCWDSGFHLLQGSTYEITMATPGDWLDRTLGADVGGFPTAGFHHIVAFPLKRWWSEDWFKPIARIGESGNDEYVLNPVMPFSPFAYRNDGAKHAPTTADPNPEKCPDPAGDALEPLSDDDAKCIKGGDPTPDERKTLVARITAKSGGRLFLYVNDAMMPFTSDPAKFYRNNRGCAQVSVVELRSDGTRRPLGSSPACGSGK
jgi:hypothetical protein